ncbi:MAG: hypothetical protein ABJE47_24195 [bacterium]
MDYLLSQDPLGVVAERRLVVDKGHEDITDPTARLPDLAEVHSSLYFDRNQAFDALHDAREEGQVSGRGYVRAGDDRRDLLLQIRTSRRWIACSVRGERWPNGCCAEFKEVA